MYAKTSNMVWCHINHVCHYVYCGKQPECSGADAWLNTGPDYMRTGPAGSNAKDPDHIQCAEKLSDRTGNGS